MSADSKNNEFIFIGLPQSGKSTFIAALWHVVESGEIGDSITITTLPNDRYYLNELRNTWLKCEPIERTKTDSIHEILLNVVDNSRNEKFSFSFPDVSGEMYAIQFESRQISAEFAQKLNSINGILVFINPDNIKKPILISDAAPLMEGMNEGEVYDDTYRPWNHKSDTPTQVVLVDLLQILGNYVTSKLKIVVIVSAWDVVFQSVDEEYKKLTPIEWIERELPLFFQFLKTNENIFDCTFFGVSAQGADYEVDKSKLVQFDKPSKRIIVRHNDEETNDITQPIKWLINGAEE